MPPACVPDAVAAAALTWFAQRVAGKKHAPNEYTVLSVLVVEQDGEWTVVSGGTGTKCVGLSGLCREGYILADSHAETMCRRAFLRYLYRELDAPTADVPPIFDIVDGKRRLKSTCRMYMYISEAPCGDAALYDLHQDALDEIHESKLKRRKLDQETVITVPCRTTGAKEAETIEHSNALGLARVKSGRSDILPENRTVSMSCSDKICKWLACGLQGNLLSQWFEPIILSGIVVSQDSKADYGSFHRTIQLYLQRT
ncbi:hypothetical protein AeNC1_008263 [Aphanomyces euteiches]|nr:hypothetical protein AeNC1_008263 [Aphanomyces euteiches]